MGYELEMGVDFSETAPNIGDEDKQPKIKVDDEAEQDGTIYEVEEPGGLWMK